MTYFLLKLVNLFKNSFVINHHQLLGPGDQIDIALANGGRETRQVE